MVLILVILDVPLRLGWDYTICPKIYGVLILVILDVPLRRWIVLLHYNSSTGLNPCYTGCASSAVIRLRLRVSPLSLNPCYTGCASSAQPCQTQTQNLTTVLILVILDVPLRLLQRCIIVRL